MHTPGQVVEEPDIREAVEACLSDDHEAEISRRIIAGYDRIPQSTPDEWGDPAAFTAAAARDLRLRLDAEERAAGHEPW